MLRLHRAGVLRVFVAGVLYVCESQELTRELSVLRELSRELPVFRELLQVLFQTDGVLDGV